MLNIKSFYSIMALLGIIVPWYFFSQFIANNGTNIVDFIQALFVNGAAAGFSSDIFLSATVFWVWSYQDSKARQVKLWWMVVPATLLVGLSLALPLYLILRMNTASDEQTVA